MLPLSSIKNQCWLCKKAGEESDFVGINFSFGFLLPAHGVIDHLDGFFIKGRLIHPVDDLLESGIARSVR